jgi:hypothetical protein
MKKLAILFIFFTLLSCSKTHLKMESENITFKAGEYNNLNTTFVSVLNQDASLIVTYSINESNDVYFIIKGNSTSATKRTLIDNNVTIETIDFNMNGKLNIIDNVVNGIVKGNNDNFIEFKNYHL